MQCHRSVKQISSDLPAIHCYFDLCPESPDGERVLYFEFTGEVPGPGNIVVARTDGSDRRIVAEVPWGSAHEAVFQQWTGPDEVAFRKADAGAVSTVIVSLTGGAAREIAMPVRMFSPDGKWGLSSPHQIRKHRATGRDGVVYLVDTSSGETRDLFTRDDVLSIHPLADDI